MQGYSDIVQWQSKYPVSALVGQMWGTSCHLCWLTAVPTAWGWEDISPEMIFEIAVVPFWYFLLSMWLLPLHFSWGISNVFSLYSAADAWFAKQLTSHQTWSISTCQWPVDSPGWLINTSRCKTQMFWRVLDMIMVYLLPAPLWKLLVWIKIWPCWKYVCPVSLSPVWLM